MNIQSNAADDFTKGNFTCMLKINSWPGVISIELGMFLHAIKDHENSLNPTDDGETTYRTLVK